MWRHLFLAASVALSVGATTRPSNQVDLPLELNKKLHAAQAAVAEAQLKLRSVIDADSSVLAARAKLDVARAGWEAARDQGQGHYQTAFERYQQAKVDEQNAELGAGGDERATVTARRKELAQVQADVQKASDEAQRNLERQRWVQTLPAEPQRSGDVDVMILAVRIAPVRLAPAATGPQMTQPLLGVVVRIENHGHDSVEYRGWNSNAIAKDKSKKQYLPADVYVGKAQGRVMEATIPPGGNVKDLIVLERPQSVHELTIVLPAFNVGGSGAMDFRIPDDKVEENSLPLFDEMDSLPRDSSTTSPGKKPALPTVRPH
jgi:hypothetical protein